MTLQFVTKVCIGCGKNFATSNNSNTCYNCTLKEITHGMPPEEGDFNTAGITSGTLSARERRYLQEDLESVECATGEEWGTEEEPEDGWDDDQEENYDEHCPECGHTIGHCTCILVETSIYMKCPKGWYCWSIAYEERLDVTRKWIRDEHATACGCGGELKEEIRPLNKS